jgi:cephalosporin-C deacetylase-like acetyl esterase
MKKVNSLPSVRPQVTTDRKGYRIEKLEFLSEPGIYIPAWVFVPNKRSPNATAILYVGDVGIEAEGLEYGVLAALARSGNLVVAVDVRGIGETEPPHDPEIRAGGEFSHLFNVETAMSYMAWFMDESLLGMRVRDVVRSVDYALGRPDVDPEGIWLVGKGMGALWVLLAAAQDPRIKRAICDGGLLCYRTLAFADRYTQGANLFIRDVLLHFDLPQVAACVASRDLVLLSPVDAMGNPVQMALARDAYQWTGEAYAAKGAGNRFRIAERSADLDVAEQYLRLLQGED